RRRSRWREALPVGSLEAATLLKLPRSCPDRVFESIRLRLRYRFIVELMNVLGDVLLAVFDSEVPSFQSMHLCLRQCFQVSFASLPRKKDIILPPEDDRLRRPLFEERLPFGI